MYLYDLEVPTRPKEVWDVGGFGNAFQIAFSPDCRFILVSDAPNHAFKVFDIKGNLLIQKHYGDYYSDKVWAVAWWKDRIAVGLEDGRIYVYKVEGYEPTTTFTVTETVTTANAPITFQTNVAPSSLSIIFEPYTELEKLYNEVSSSTGYKALVLKGPFQRNVFYLTQLSSLADILTRLNQFYQDLDNSLSWIKKLMNEKPTLKVVFKIMSLIQRAKVDMALIKATLAQADQLEKSMVSNKPTVSCAEDPAKIIEGILNANSVSEVLKWRLEAKKQGGLDNVVKCLISKTVDEFSKNYQAYKEKLLKDLNNKEKEIKKLEELAKLLSIS